MWGKGGENDIGVDFHVQKDVEVGTWIRVPKYPYGSQYLYVPKYLKTYVSA